MSGSSTPYTDNYSGAPAADVCPRCGSPTNVDVTDTPPSGSELGTLTVLLKRAEALKAMDLNGFSDPYVKLRCGGQEAKSKVIKKTLGPVCAEDGLVGLWLIPMPRLTTQRPMVRIPHPLLSTILWILSIKLGLGKSTFE